MTYLLEAKNISKAFKAFEAVKGISLSVKHGECLALLGPNGAGKTTTFEMLEGLLKPDSGESCLFGKTWQADRSEILSRIGVQLQETSLYKRFTVKETLDLFGSFYKKRRSISELLELVELTDKIDTELRNLSGGQKQRVYIAAALINDPELIFLDEPTTGLDPLARRGVWKIIENLKKQGVGILLSTHHMEEAEFLASRVVIMDTGKIIAEGTSEELIAKHAGGEKVTVRHGTLEDVFLNLTGRGLENV